MIRRSTGKILFGKNLEGVGGKGLTTDMDLVGLLIFFERNKNYEAIFQQELVPYSQSSLVVLK
jgi:hypothetical protein